MKKTKRILIEEDEPSQRDIEKAAKKVKRMKSGKPVRVRKAWTDPKRNYAQEALKTGATKAKARIAASHAKPDRPKPSTERVYTSTEITNAKRDATKKRVGRGESSRKISNKEATILIRAREMTEYQRIGAVLAEAMGHRVDELAFLPALATAGRVVGPIIASKLVDKGVESAADKLKKKKLAAQAASDKELKESETMNKFVKKLMEAHEADRNRRGTSDPTGFAYPIARESGAKRSSKAIKDPVARRGAKKAKAKMEKKLKLKPGSTKPQAQHMVQVHLNDRLAKRRKREEAAKKRGNRDTTPSIIPQESERDRRAGVEADRKKVSDAGEQ